MRSSLPKQHAGIARALQLADQYAYTFALQAPWPTLADALEDDDAIGALQDLDPDYQPVLADYRALQADLTTLNRTLPARLSDILCRYTAVTEHAAMLFGLALGQRLNLRPSGHFDIDVTTEAGINVLMAKMERLKRENPAAFARAIEHANAIDTADQGGDAQ